MFPSKLAKMEADYLFNLKNARSDEAKAKWKRRLQCVRIVLNGGEVLDDPVPKPVRVDRLKPKPATPEEILEGARYLVSIGKEHLLNDEQRKALR